MPPTSRTPRWQLAAEVTAVVGRSEARGMAMAAVVPVNVLFALLAVPGLIHLGVLGGLAVVGGVPAWTHLDASRTPPEREAGPAPGS